MKNRKPLKENIFLYLYNANNTKKNILQFPIRNNSKISYPNTNEKNIIPNDINLTDIFNQMVKIYNEISENKNNSLYIKLSQEQAFQRKILLESIKSFALQNQIKNKILYNIIFLFDFLMAKNERKKLTNSLEKIGLGATILTMKFNHEENRMITMKKYRNIFKNKYYSSRDIKEIELLCLTLCDYNLLFPSPISFMEILLLNTIISNQDDVKKESKKNIINLIINTLEKIIYDSNEYMKYNPLYLCCCIIYYVREMYGLEKWPRILANLFNINYQKFEVIYNEYFRANKDKDKENYDSNNFDYSNNNNNSTNIGSYVNCNNSKKNDKNEPKTEIKVKNPIFNIIMNNSNNCNIEKDINLHKINIKTINLYINNGIINNFIKSENKRRKYTKSVDIKNNKREIEKYLDRQEDNNFIYKNKSMLNNYYEHGNNNRNIFAFNNNEKYKNYKKNKNNNINKSKIEPQSVVKTVFSNNNNNLQIIPKNEISKEKENIKIEDKEQVKDIRISLKQFIRKNKIKSSNKNLDKFINTESNMNLLLMKKNNIKYEENNNISFNKNDNRIFNNNEIINSFSANEYNLKKGENNKSKKYSSCDKYYGAKKACVFKDSFENEYRRNHCFLKKSNYNLYNKQDDIFDENNSFINNSILNNEINFKKRNKSLVYPISKNTEIFSKTKSKNRLKRYNNNRFNTMICEKSKCEQQQNNRHSDNMFKIGKKPEYTKNFRLKSLENFYGSKINKKGIDLNYENSKIKKRTNIRNFYKQRIANKNKLLDKTSNVLL